MTFTGTLIEDLIASVERAEQSALCDEALGCDFPITDAWFASVQENVEYERGPLHARFSRDGVQDSRLVGVA